MSLIGMEPCRSVNVHQRAVKLMAPAMMGRAAKGRAMSKFGLGIAAIIFATALSVADFAIAKGGHGGGHGGGRGGGHPEVDIGAVDTAMATISAAGIMAAGIFTAGRITVHSQHIARSPNTA